MKGSKICMEELSVAQRLMVSGSWEKFISGLSAEEAQLLEYEWSFWGRPKQLGVLEYGKDVLMLCGRGFGKTRTGSETVHEVAGRFPARIALVAQDIGEVRKVMVEGDSGLLSCNKPSNPCIFVKNVSEVRWKNGSIATFYSGEDPNKLRGPQFHFAWGDELSSWRDPGTYDMLKMCLRLRWPDGREPMCLFTTTPKNVPLVRLLASDPYVEKVYGTSYENRMNLSAKALEEWERRYAGTRLGDQELKGMLFTDMPGALWVPRLIDEYRIMVGDVVLGSRHGMVYKPLKWYEGLLEVVVGVDPATSGGGVHGIVVCGRHRDGMKLVLEDVSVSGNPAQWGMVVCEAVERWKRWCSRVSAVVETNQGGDMALDTVRRAGEGKVAVRPVFQKKGKHARAEPCVAEYAQGKVSHVGVLADLENEMLSWVEGESRWSPNRMDAMVIGLTALGNGVSSFLGWEKLAKSGFGLRSYVR